MELFMNLDLATLSKSELKQYLSENRNNGEKFSVALQELINRNPEAPVDPPMGWEETREVVEQKINRLKTEKE